MSVSEGWQVPRGPLLWAKLGLLSVVLAAGTGMVARSLLGAGVNGWMVLGYAVLMLAAGLLSWSLLVVFRYDCGQSGCPQRSNPWHAHQRSPDG